MMTMASDDGRKTPSNLSFLCVRVWSKRVKEKWILSAPFFNTQIFNIYDTSANEWVKSCKLLESITSKYKHLALHSNFADLVFLSIIQHLSISFTFFFSRPFWESNQRPSGACAFWEWKKESSHSAFRWMSCILLSKRSVKTNIPEFYGTLATWILGAYSKRGKASRYETKWNERQSERFETNTTNSRRVQVDYTFWPPISHWIIILTE